jgi:hypothetical protein
MPLFLALDGRCETSETYVEDDMLATRELRVGNRKGRERRTCTHNNDLDARLGLRPVGVCHAGEFRLVDSGAEGHAFSDSDSIDLYRYSRSIMEA